MNVYAYDILRHKSQDKFTMDKIVKQKELVKNTVGVITVCYRVELEMLINLYSRFDRRIDELDEQNPVHLGLAACVRKSKQAVSKVSETINRPVLSSKRAITALLENATRKLHLFSGHFNRWSPRFLIWFMRRFW